MYRAKIQLIQVYRQALGLFGYGDNNGCIKLLLKLILKDKKQIDGLTR